MNHNRFMPFLDSCTNIRQVYQLSTSRADFEQSYLPVREREGRVYSDELVQQLPRLSAQHPHYHEWKLRRKSCQRVIDFIQKNTSLKVLDLGCGNGWFTRHLASRRGIQVLGADINKLELEQAARLFSSLNCRFAYGDIFDEVWPEAYFDQVVLNSCIQYFTSLPVLLHRLMALVRPEGIIHILDSPIYPAQQVAAARQRSVDYFTRQGHPEMATYYHHHSWDDLNAFSHEVVYAPNKPWSRLRRKILGDDSPFPWIIVQNRAET